MDVVEKAVKLMEQRVAEIERAKQHLAQAEQLRASASEKENAAVQRLISAGWSQADLKQLGLQLPKQTRTRNHSTPRVPSIKHLPPAVADDSSQPDSSGENDDQQ